MDLNVVRDGKSQAIPIGDLNEQLVRRIVTKNEHPNPVIIMCYVVIILVIMYYIYVTLIKPSFSGRWYFDDKNYYKICHNKWSDTISVKMADETVMDGWVHGRAIYLDDGKMGVLLKNEIHWNGGELWKRALKSE